MDEKKKDYPEPVEALMLVLGIYAGLFLISIFFSDFSGSAFTPDDINKSARYFFIFGGILFLIVPLAYAYAKKYQIQNLFRFKAVPMHVIFLSILIGLSVTVLGDELDRLVNLIFPIPEWLSDLMKPMQAENPTDLFLVISGAVVIAAVAEEALFRGFIQVTLERKGDITRAVLLAAVAWCLIHGIPYWFLQIFITGVILGFLAWRSDSIIPGVIVHAVNNFIAVLVINIDFGSTFDWYEWRGHVSPFVLVIAGGLLFWSVKQVTVFYKKG